MQKLRRRVDAEEESRARSRQVEGDSAGRAHLARDERRVAEEVVGTRGGHDDEIDLLWVHPRVLQRVLHRRHRKPRQRLAWLQQVARADACSLRDPLIVRVDELLEHAVAHAGLGST